MFINKKYGIEPQEFVDALCKELSRSDIIEECKKSIAVLINLTLTFEPETQNPSVLIYNIDRYSEEDKKKLLSDINNVKSLIENEDFFKVALAGLAGAIFMNDEKGNPSNVRNFVTEGKLALKKLSPKDIADSFTNQKLKNIANKIFCEI